MIYSMMEQYSDAVNLALMHRKYKYAKIIASKPFNQKE